MRMNKKYSQGLTLVEIMVAMLIGITLMGGVTLIMFNSQRTYTAQGDMARLQENARFAMDFITQDLRSTGYFGCSGAQPQGTISIGSFDGVSREGDGPNNSDSLDISFLETGPAAFAVVNQNPTSIEPLDVGETIFTATSPGAIRESDGGVPGDEVVASDCGGNSPAYQVNNVNGDTITINTGLNRTYNNQGQVAGAELRRLIKYRYRVAPVDIDGNVVDAADAFTFSLVRDIIGPAPGFNIVNSQDLVQGVESMQVRYGEDTDSSGSPNQYVTFDNVVNFLNVRSVRIALLMRTIQDRASSSLDLDTRTYELEPGQAAYDPVDDFRLRRVFSTVVLLRNNTVVLLRNN